MERSQGPMGNHPNFSGKERPKQQNSVHLWNIDPLGWLIVITINDYDYYFHTCCPSPHFIIEQNKTKFNFFCMTIRLAEGIIEDTSLVNLAFNVITELVRSWFSASVCNNFQWRKWLLMTIKILSNTHYWKVISIQVSRKFDTPAMKIQKT